MSLFHRQQILDNSHLLFPLDTNLTIVTTPTTDYVLSLPITSSNSPSVPKILLDAPSSDLELLYKKTQLRTAEILDTMKSSVPQRSSRGGEGRGLQFTPSTRSGSSGSGDPQTKQNYSTPDSSVSSGTFTRTTNTNTDRHSSSPLQSSKHIGSFLLKPPGNPSVPPCPPHLTPSRNHKGNTKLPFPRIPITGGDVKNLYTLNRRKICCEEEKQRRRKAEEKVRLLEEKIGAVRRLLLQGGREGEVLGLLGMGEGMGEGMGQGQEEQEGSEGSEDFGEEEEVERKRRRLAVGRGIERSMERGRARIRDTEEGMEVTMTEDEEGQFEMLEYPGDLEGCNV
ncbi:Protein of unknown function [Pyronema omphalodes CBS 100304]|uniref:Uncharacterized protein n=1 Tax=Pyronema omphalodes (strain CBS 100304) TaxID=1076935 RepID=U4LDW7_PYROM|nr:Protein of unknown function [Pyronema omphalodes CBS 100304]